MSQEIVWRSALAMLVALGLASCSPPYKFQKRYPNPDGTISLVMDVEKERGDLGTQQVEVFLEQDATREYVGHFDHFTPLEPQWVEANSVNVCELSGYPDFRRSVNFGQRKVFVGDKCPPGG